MSYNLVYWLWAPTPKRGIREENMWPYDEIYFKGIHLDRYGKSGEKKLWNSIAIQDLSNCRNNKNKILKQIRNIAYRIMTFFISNNQKVQLKTHLRGLSDHLLDDIGINRGDVEAIIAGSFQRPITKRKSTFTKEVSVEIYSKSNIDNCAKHSKKVAA